MTAEIPDLNETEFGQYPIVSPAQMREIYGIDETGEFLKEVLDESIDQALTTSAELHEACDARDFNRVRERAHFLKGSMAQLGLKRLNQICLVMQFYIDKVPQDQIDVNHLNLLIQRLDEAISASLQYLYVTPDKSKINEQLFELLSKH